MCKTGLNQNNGYIINSQLKHRKVQKLILSYPEKNSEHFMTHHWFSREMMSEKRALKLHADDALEANFRRSRTRCGFTPASTALRELVRFFILNLFLVIKNTFQVKNWPISCLNDSETQKRGL